MRSAAPGLLSGRRGWAVVTTLSLVLGLAVAEQAPRRDASAQPVTVTLSAAPASVLRLDTTDRPFARPELVQRAAAPAPVAPQPAPAAPRAAPRVPQPVTPAAAPPPAPAAAPAPAANASGLCSGEGWQQRRGQAALDSLRAGADRTGFRVQFKGGRKGYMGLTHLKQRRIEMFVRSCDAQSDALLRHVMAHELGHAWDTTHMTTASRAAWMRVRGIPAGSNWYGCSGCTDFATPAGDFAEVYAQWARGASSNKSKLAGSPAPGQLAALARQFFGA
jgi:pyruvate/2-oxoglutarate dehydrogenase complex dihydrolipoamide acyltransferase (E2) component